MGSCCSNGAGGAESAYRAEDTADPAVAMWHPQLFVVVLRSGGRLELRNRRRQADRRDRPIHAAAAAAAAAAGCESDSSGQDALSTHNTPRLTAGAADVRADASTTHSDAALHDSYDGDHAAEEYLVTSASSMTEYESDGRLTTEPNSILCSLRESSIALRARVRFDINGAIDQFEVPPEHPDVLRLSDVKGRSWLPESHTHSRSVRDGGASSSSPSPSEGMHGVWMPQFGDSSQRRMSSSLSSSTTSVTGVFGRARRAPLTIDALTLHNRLLQWSEADHSPGGAPGGGRSRPHPPLQGTTPPLRGLPNQPAPVLSGGLPPPLIPPGRATPPRSRNQR